MFCFMRISFVVEINKTVVACRMHTTYGEREENCILVIKWTLMKACLGNPLRSQDGMEVFFFSLPEALPHCDLLLLPEPVYDGCEMLQVWQNMIGVSLLGFFGHSLGFCSFSVGLLRKHCFWQCSQVMQLGVQKKESWCFFLFWWVLKVLFFKVHFCWKENLCSLFQFNLFMSNKKPVTTQICLRGFVISHFTLQLHLLFSHLCKSPQS